MINKEIFKKIIIEYQKSIPKISLIARDIIIEPSLRYVFVGLRRAGKSYIMFSDIQQRIRTKGISMQDILYVNFEDERLNGMELSDFDSILESYREMYDNRTPYIYFDEIQNIEGWEKYVRRLADSGLHVWVTGSNAKMLSREISSTLGGRFVVKYIPTFSYKDYLKYNGITISHHWRYDKEETLRLRKYLRDYFQYGGFAETFGLVNKREWVNSLYQKILLGDIVARNGYRNDRAISFLARKLAESVKQPSTQTRFLNTIKSTGIQISRNTVAEYLDSLDAAYLTFNISNYRHSLSERSLESKRYFSDNGLLNNFLIDGNTSLLENLVAIELMKRHYFGSYEDVYYYRNGIEVDFYIPISKMAIQVAYTVEDWETLEREAKALAKLSKVVDVEKCYIVTYDDANREIEYDGQRIEVVNLLEFLIH